MDASFNPKSGKKTFGLDWFYHGSHSRSEWGLEVSVIALVNRVTKDSYAINAQQTYNQGQNPLLTRIDYALIQLDQTRQYWPKRVNDLAVDAAYAKEKFITGAIHYGLQVVSKLRMPTFATSMTGHKKPEVARESMMARSISVMSRA